MTDKIVLCAGMALAVIWLMVVLYHTMGISEIQSKKYKIMLVIVEVIAVLGSWLLVTKFIYSNIPEQVVNSIDFR